MPSARTSTAKGAARRRWRTRPMRSAGTPRRRAAPAFEAILSAIELKRGGSGTPRLRLLLREHRLRPGHHRPRRDVHRPAARRQHRGHGRQDQLAPGRGEGRRRRRPRSLRSTHEPRRGGRVRRGARCPSPIKAAFGGGSRGMEGRPRRRPARPRPWSRRRARRRPTSDGQESTSGGTLTWPRRLEIPGARRHAQDDAVAGRAWLLRPATPPKLVEESPAPAFGGEVRRAPWAKKLRSRSPRPAAATGAGNGQDSSSRDGEFYFLRDEHPPPGRAPGHRAASPASAI